MDSIGSYDEFTAIENYFLENGKIRDWALWTGVSLGLRISDLTALKIKYVLNEDLSFKDRIRINEMKTGKANEPLVTESIRHALIKYFDSIDWEFDLDDYIFKSQKKGKMTPQYGWKLISDAAKALKIDNAIGSHTMRKSFVSIMLCLLKTSIDINSLAVAQLALKHNDLKTTMRYMGITEKLLDKGRMLVSDFVLGKSGTNELTIGTSTTPDDVMDKLEKLEKILEDMK